MSQHQKRSFFENQIAEIELPDFIKFSINQSRNNSLAELHSSNSQQDVLISDLDSFKNRHQQIEYSVENSLPLSRREKGKVYAKTYRDRKKQQIQELQEENRYLKKKVSDLSFRLREAELEINKMKHQSLSQHICYPILRKNCLSKIQETLSASEIPEARLEKLQEDVKDINSLQNRHRLDLLNYHMGEVLDNLLLPSAFYFTDCYINELGIWRQGSTKLRKIDREIFEILGITSQEEELKVKQQIPEVIMRQCRIFRNLWISLYSSYLKVMNQGSFVSSIVKQTGTTCKTPSEKQAVLKMQVHLENTKYGKQIREALSSWYKECQLQPHQSIERILGQKRKH